MARRLSNSKEVNCDSVRTPTASHLHKLLPCCSLGQAKSGILAAEEEVESSSDRRPCIVLNRDSGLSTRRTTVGLARRVRQARPSRDPPSVDLWHRPCKAIEIGRCRK